MELSLFCLFIIDYVIAPTFLHNICFNLLLILIFPLRMRKHRSIFFQSTRKNIDAPPPQTYIPGWDILLSNQPLNTTLCRWYFMVFYTIIFDYITEKPIAKQSNIRIPQYLYSKLAVSVVHDRLVSTIIIIIIIYRSCRITNGCF